jgi:hypothetical protein
MTRPGLSALLSLLLATTGCLDNRFIVKETQPPEKLYASLFPYYVEYCALSEIKKKPNHGVEVVGGGPGGHSLLFLSGACRVKDAGYPTVKLCPTDEVAPGVGVGISVNAHFRNANWVATEGRDFFFRGQAEQGEPLTDELYWRTQARAREQGILDGIIFHDEVMASKPVGMDDQTFMYEMSVATDYAIALGRDRYCVRMPVERAELGVVVDALNAANEPFRKGEKTFEWDVVKNNCAHVVHNALAPLHLWRHWPTDRFVMISALDFPVPKNELVNLVRITNDKPLPRPSALYGDPPSGTAPRRRVGAAPGALVESERVLMPNDVYDTDLTSIFYEFPPFTLRQRFLSFYANERYTDLGANLRWFSKRNRALLARPEQASSSSHDRALFQRLYRDYLARQAQTVEQWLAALPGVKSTGEGQ